MSISFYLLRNGIISLGIFTLNTVITHPLIGYVGLILRSSAVATSSWRTCEGTCTYFNKSRTTTQCSSCGVPTAYPYSYFNLQYPHKVLCYMRLIRPVRRIWIGKLSYMGNIWYPLTFDKLCIIFLDIYLSIHWKYLLISSTLLFVMIYDHKHLIPAHKFHTLNSAKKRWHAIR